MHNPDRNTSALFGAPSSSSTSGTTSTPSSSTLDATSPGGAHAEFRQSLPLAGLSDPPPIIPSTSLPSYYPETRNNDLLPSYTSSPMIPDVPLGADHAGPSSAYALPAPLAGPSTRHLLDDIPLAPNSFSGNSPGSHRGSLPDTQPGQMGYAYGSEFSPGPSAPKPWRPQEREPWQDPQPPLGLALSAGSNYPPYPSRQDMAFGDYPPMDSFGGGGGSGGGIGGGGGGAAGGDPYSISSQEGGFRDFPESSTNGAPAGGLSGSSHAGAARLGTDDNRALGNGYGERRQTISSLSGPRLADTRDIAPRSYSVDVSATGEGGPGPKSAGYPGNMYSGVLPDSAVTWDGGRDLRGEDYAQAMALYEHLHSAVPYLRPISSSSKSDLAGMGPDLQALLHYSADGAAILSGRFPGRGGGGGEGGGVRGSGSRSPPSRGTGPGGVAVSGTGSSAAAGSGGAERAGGAGGKKGARGDAKAQTKCLGCGATETPEWRRGPMGPRTLCNACGLVHMKLQRKRRKMEEAAAAGKGGGSVKDRGGG